MTKVHVIMKKEEIVEEKMKGKIAVVFDILLATSTITCALVDGAKAVIPVPNAEEAHVASNLIKAENHILAGEYEGKTIEGFYDPMPTILKDSIQGKYMILSTTNGTVAINQSKKANKIYICSLLNGKAVANTITHFHKDDSIIIVCSGSSDQFCLEDFYGAGHLIYHLQEKMHLQLTDSAKAARLFYESNKSVAETILLSSRVGEMLVKYGFINEVKFVSQKDCFEIVPFFDGEKIIAGGECV
ncbi:2-phosphosulfolactate phosphatase [Metabacillus litoralis]|uniref:2-phosphosulfolactate phosphatase n=1 Tax=Metabacillus TaxID=2675233 RepID=UPI00203F7A28|nr:2-phosphosulfolactate phosphatase [Metabacillus litoralis]MCM3160218.1 2-phosphosulfolactate phosphatase [Metabacillus litoralis]